MKRMAESNVLICGLNGVGCEIGVKSVTLSDSQNLKWTDLTSQFYADEKVGQNRVSVSLEKLRDLNPYCSVSSTTEKISPEFLKNGHFKVVVFCDEHLTNLVEMNQICRSLDIKFIAVESRGLAGCIFVDFGEKFEILDTDGENPITSVITNITNSNPGVVTVDEEHRHGLYTGDKVVFEGIEGMDELNQLTPMPITQTGLFTFTICDTTNFKRYERGGYVTQVKEKVEKRFDSLAEGLKNPKNLLTDFGKESRPAELHAAFQALAHFVAQHSRYPSPWNQKDAQEVFDLAVKISGNDQLNKDIITKFAYTCQGDLSPMAAFLGGFAAQEVQKACSGKFSPLDNFLYFEAFEVLNGEYPTEKDAQPLKSRYDGQIVVFGNKFQQVLHKQRYFLVGAGALGCEYLKSFALMGMGTEKGQVYITDMDSIETSNLNRQFLFRQKHVGSLKSTTAAEVSRTMNPEFNIKALQDKVAPETEHIFDDEFWDGLDFVVNALDNVQARLYVDSRCIYFQKPLMESGTLGTKGNTQVCVPFLTESYGSSRDPPEKEIPICTLKNFPNQIEHTIQYARDLFEGMFTGTPNDCNRYLSDPKGFSKHLDEQGLNKVTIVKNVFENLVTSKPRDFDDCIAWARLKFEDLFHNQIAQLLYNFPEDMLTSTGTPFWGAGKKVPQILNFNVKDKTHLDFVVSAANLRAFNFGIKQRVFGDSELKTLTNMNVPKFQPKTGIKIATTKEEAESLIPDDDKDTKDLLAQLPNPDGNLLQAAEFEKDDDTNFHIDFITAASNLRASNYKIPNADRHKTKGIAGKIIPAMVTTTALITGLASFEILKLVRGVKKLEDYKNSFVNIGLPFMTQSDPIAPTKQKYLDKEWSLWDRLDVNAGKDLTMKEFLDFFQKEHKLEITMMSAGTAVIYNMFTSKEKLAARFNTKMSEVVESIQGKKILPKQKYINFAVCCNDENGDDADVPEVRYKFRF